MNRRARRIVGGIVVVCLIGVALRLAMAPTPIQGYRPIDDFNLVVQVIGIQPQWRGLTVTESDSTVAVEIREIWIHGPGFDDAIAYILVRLHEPLGTRTVVDASTGLPVGRIRP